MNTKLTLRLDEDVIVRIKNHVNKQQLSLSKFTENIFREVLKDQNSDSQNLSPIVNKYKGILKNSKFNNSEELTDYLIEKHS